MAYPFFVPSYCHYLRRAIFKAYKNVFTCTCSFIHKQTVRKYNNSLKQFYIPNMSGCLVQRATTSIILRNNAYCRSSTTCSSGTASSTNNKRTEIPNFRKLLDFKIKQANKSVLIEVPSEKYLFATSELLAQSFELKDEFHYISPSGKNFILAELCSIEAVWNLLHKCNCAPRNGQIQTFSRIIKYNNNSLKINGTAKEKEKFRLAKCSRIGDASKFDTQSELLSVVSKTVEDFFYLQRLGDEEIQLRFFLCSQISDFLRGIFGHCKIVPFGSSVNGFGNNTSDVDAVILPYNEKEGYKSEIFFKTKHPLQTDHEQQILQAVRSILMTFLPGISSVDYVYQTKVPLVKFQHNLLEMSFDISLSNISGLQMTELLFYCGHIDSRLQPLAFAIKKWAKESKVTSDTASHTISNFSLILLLVFFLQTRPQPVLPSFCKLSKTIDLVKKENLQFVAFNYSFSNEETLDNLLKEFFIFLKLFDFKKKGISTYQGKVIKKVDNSPIFIENPLVPELNVSHNVTKNSYIGLRQAAASAVNRLEILMRNEKIIACDFWNILSSTEAK